MLGVIGRPAVPGRLLIGWAMAFVVGIVGALIGGSISSGLDLAGRWQVVGVQAAVAAILVALISTLVRAGSLDPARMAANASR